MLDGDEQLTDIPTEWGGTLSLNFATGEWSYQPPATIDGDKVTFGPMAGTLMACAEAIMDQERKFYDALDRTASFGIDAEGKLVLLDADGAELARFSAS